MKSLIYILTIVILSLSVFAIPTFNFTMEGRSDGNANKLINLTVNVTNSSSDTVYINTFINLSVDVFSTYFTFLNISYDFHDQTYIQTAINEDNLSNKSFIGYVPYAVYAEYLGGHNWTDVLNQVFSSNQSVITYIQNNYFNKSEISYNLSTKLQNGSEDANLRYLKLSSLTATRVPFYNAVFGLVDSNLLYFDGTTLYSGGFNAGLGTIAGSNFIGGSMAISGNIAGGTVQGSNICYTNSTGCNQSFGNSTYWKLIGNNNAVGNETIDGALSVTRTLSINGTLFNQSANNISILNYIINNYFNKSESATNLSIKLQNGTGEDATLRNINVNSISTDNYYNSLGNLGLRYDLGGSNKWEFYGGITFNGDVEVLNGLHGPNIGGTGLTDTLNGATLHLAGNIYDNQGTPQPVMNVPLRKLYASDGITEMMDFSTVGTVNLGNNNLTLNGHLGLGTPADATYVLKVLQSTGDMSNVFWNTGGGGNFLKLVTALNYAFLEFDGYGTGYDWILGMNGNNNLAIIDNVNGKTPFAITPNAKTNSIVITATGVGIGAPVPTSNFMVQTNFAGDQNSIFQNIKDGYGSFLTVSALSNYVSVVFEDYGVQTWYFGMFGTNNFEIQDPTGGKVPVKVIANSPTNSLIVGTSGVNIKGVSALDTLDVGDVSAQGVDVISHSGIYSASNTASTYGIASHNPTGTNFFTMAGVENGGVVRPIASLGSIVTDMTAGAWSGDMIFYTWLGGTRYERMRLNSTGFLFMNGSIEINGNLTYKNPHATFSSNQTFTVASANVMYPFHLNQTEENYLISTEGKENITIQQSGSYEFKITYATKSSAASSMANVWFQITNSSNQFNNIPRSNKPYQFKSTNSVTSLVAIRVIDMNSTQKIKLVYDGDNTGVSFPYIGATSPVPETQSITVTINKVSAMH